MMVRFEGNLKPLWINTACIESLFADDKGDTLIYTVGSVVGEYYRIKEPLAKVVKRINDSLSHP